MEEEQRTTTTTSANPNQTTRVTRTSVTGTPSGTTLMARIVYLVLGVLEGLLLIRFVLALLGANRANDFAQFVFELSTPFVAPFKGLFNVQTVYGASRFEVETLVAMIIYALIGAVILAIARLPSRSEEV